MITEYVADMMIKPGKSPVFGTPGDYGLNYQDVEFKAKDGTTLSGWLIRGGTEKVVIQSHFGVQCSRAGYTPREKGMIKMWPNDIHFLRQTQHFVALGYSVLMYDFRNHGASAAGKCPFVTWGPEEAQDVLAAVDYIANHPDLNGARIGLLSICMGAASSAYAYGVPGGLQEYSNIKAMVAVQPLLYPDFVKALGVPGFLDRWVNDLNLERTGIDLNESSFMPHVQHIPVPTLVIQNENDPWANLDSVKKFYDELKVEKSMLWLKLEKSRAASYHHLTENPETAGDFFEKYLSVG